MKKNEELRVKSEELAACVVRRNSSFRSCKFLTLHSSLLTSPSGFSLVEVMLAIGIVAFAVVGILTAFPVGIDAARDARDETAAALIADDVFTRLRSQPFGNNVVWPEVPWKKVAAGLKTDYATGLANNMSGTPVNNMFYYARDGRPANADSTADGKPPSGASKGDEGYFGVRIYVNNDPYSTRSSNASGQDIVSNLQVRDDISYVNVFDLSCVIVEVSWPARQPYDNRKFKRQFHTAICNFH